ncbi:hypothetical protein RhiirA4_545927 [Rhizophagus irregularis]|uniref:Protein kinase domain-containing protein n=1 Tax=Rhizophagus irregularis TaxID=588596 RepID=A0A2I1GUR4_9GLOM|nr:hypothetical protein RhiirA4_545927 [Rhizophagus irregularis]
MSSASTSTVPSLNKVIEYDTEQLIVFLREKNLNLTENEFKILHEQQVSGRAFLRLTERNLQDPPFNFLSGPASEIVKLVEQLKRLNQIIEYDTEQLIIFLREKNLNLTENDFKIFREQQVSGRAFLRLTKRELLDPPFNFLGGPALEIAELVEQLIQSNQRVLSLEEYLSYTIPYIAYSSLGTSSKSSTKVSGNPPIKVVLWDEFLNEVNSHKFDQETEYKEPPPFVFDYINTNEETVRNSYNNNVCRILNRVIKDIQFAMQFLDGTGYPDFCCHLIVKDKLLFPIEINVLVTNDQKISDLFNNKEDSELAPKVRQIIQQIYNYMIENKMKYGVLSTYNDHWFIKRECDILFISENIKYNSTHPSVLKSYAYLIKLAKNDTYSSDPRIIEKPDDSLCPFRKPKHDNCDDDDDDLNSSHNPSKKSKQSFFKQSSQSSKWSSSEQSYSSISKKRKQRKQSIEAQRFNYRDFKYNRLLSAGENNKKVLECEFRGKTIALKSTDLTKKPKCLDEFLNEVKIYKVLAKLQGIYIPELLFYGDLANGMSFVMGMTIVGTSLNHHRIDRRLKNRVIMTLKKVHEYNILHNDIRKENILIDEKGYVYLIDFGFSIQTYDENMFREEKAQLERLLEYMM